MAEYGAPCILLPFVKEDVPVKERAPAILLYVPPKLIAVVPIVIAELVFNATPFKNRFPPLGVFKYKLLFDDACIQCFAPADPYICITPSSKFPVSNDPKTNDGFEAVGVVKLDKPYLICVLEFILL